MPVPDVREVHDPDRSAAHDEAVTRDGAEQREYRRPQAFRVGSATRLVRGGLFGKAQDGYTGYYMEP
jgi:hypothetical protein